VLESPGASKLCAVLGALLAALALLALTPAIASAKPSHPSRSWAAGYFFDTLPPLTSLGATAMLPTYTCKKADGLTIQINVFDEVANNQDDGYSAAVVDLGCSQKKVPEYTAKFEILGKYTSSAITLKAGDSVGLSLSCSATAGTLVSITDATSGSSDSASSGTPSTCLSPVVGDLEMTKPSGGPMPLPKFGAISFSNATADGSPIGSALFPQVANYYEGAKNVIDTGSPLDGGTAFTTTQVPS
jgi:Peptidase A4 family